jgi:hypothetical protein
MIKGKVEAGILFVLFGIHLSLPLTLSNIVIVPEILVSTFLLISGYIFRALINRKLLLLLSTILLISVVSILFSPDWIEHYGAHLRSTLNLMFSLLVALAAVIYLLTAERRTSLTANVKVFFIIALAFSALEITAPIITSIVDAFRYAVFPVERIYTAEWRDVELFNVRRPTFFGNEPSYLGITLATLAVCLSVVQPKLWTQLVAMGFLILAIFIVRSPTALPIALIIVFVFFSDILRGRFRLWQGFVLLQIPILLILVSVFVLDVFGARIEQMLAGEDNSADVRLVKPALAAKLSMTHSPLVGVGVGGRDKLVDEILSVGDWSRHTDYVFGRDRISDFFATGTFLIITDMGALSAVMLFLIFLAFRSVLQRITFLEFLLCFVVISITMGGWTHPRLWLLMGLVLLFLHLRRADSEDVRGVSMLAEPRRPQK